MYHLGQLRGQVIAGNPVLFWATQRLREYNGKGFVLDDELLQNPDQAGQISLFSAFGDPGLLKPFSTI